ncbi:MAG TPA: tRNA adenosine(34) deaminase TadA [Anaerolineae bacterium]|nr:tRNA adenosine(34) deaminase TadA [Anaerolineae bacterium]
MCYNGLVRGEVEHQRYMREALEEAQVAGERGEVPVGAVAVHKGYIVGRGHNRKEELADPSAHAEMSALREAAQVLGSWRLSDVTLYCTMEPCPMCAGAMVLARLPRLVYAVDDPKSGAAGSVFDILRSPRLNHQVQVTKGVLADEARTLLDRFFDQLRGRVE